jgi:hypothetical protein
MIRTLIAVRFRWAIARNTTVIVVNPYLNVNHGSTEPVEAKPQEVAQEGLVTKIKVRIASYTLVEVAFQAIQYCIE